MERAFSVSLYHLEPLDKNNVKELRRKLLEARYDNERGLGFKSVSMHGDYLSATLVKRTPVIIPQFDLIKDQMVEQEIFLYTEIEFVLDCAFQLLEVFGAAKDVSKVRSALRPYLASQSRLFSANLNPANIIPLITRHAAQIKIEKLTVNNFQHRPGIIGKYEMRFEDSSLAHGIIGKYADNVVRTVLTVKYSDVSDFSLALAYGDRITVQCQEDEFDLVLTHLKSALFGGK